MLALNYINLIIQISPFHILSINFILAEIKIYEDYNLSNIDAPDLYLRKNKTFFMIKLLIKYLGKRLDFFPQEVSKKINKLYHKKSFQMIAHKKIGISSKI